MDGFKTGTISAAGYCLSATAVKNGHRIISVVMKSSNDRTRHTDSRALLDYGFAMVEYQSPYTDVAYHWCREDVASLKDLGVELHASGDSFRPDEAITRAEFTAMLYTALERSNALPELPETASPEETTAPENTTLPEETPASEEITLPEETPMTEETVQTEPLFYDIYGHWAQDYIQKAAQLDLITGTDGYFTPDRPITRQEMMVVLDRCLELPDDNGLGFSDDDDIALWALEAAARTSAAGLFQGGNGNTLRPEATCSRAEAVTVLSRVIDML